MTGRRLTFGHLVALVELTAAVLVAGWSVVLGVRAGAGGADRSGVDQAAPFLLGGAVAAGLTVLAFRSWRTAEQAAAGGSGSPPADRPTGPPPGSVSSHGTVPPPPPVLSADGRRDLARVVAALAAAGVLAPAVPDPADLSEAAADYGEPVTAESALRALDEADWYHPGFAASAYTANLAFHASHTEQGAEVLQDQVHDLVRLAGGGLAGVTAAVEIGHPERGCRVPTVVRLAVGAEERMLAYAGAAKYLSTVLHVTLAQVLHERGTGRRLAWLWSDQGVWLSGLADGGVERLNAVLPGPTDAGWAWVDEQPPHAAGEIHPDL